jgi:hypothetical protein
MPLVKGSWKDRFSEWVRHRGSLSGWNVGAGKRRRRPAPTRTDEERLGDPRYWDAARPPLTWLIERAVRENPGLVRELGEPEQLLAHLRPEALSEVDEIRAGAPLWAANWRAHIQPWTAELYDHWRTAFDQLDWLNSISMQYFIALDKRLETHGTTNETLPYVLMRLAGRSSQAAREVAWLLRGGWPEAAHARWRTLYELSVTATYMREGGLAAAERFRAHETLMRLNPDDDELPDDALPGTAAHDLGWSDARTIRELKNLYGKGFEGRYGWAVDAHGKALTTFAQLEAAANMTSWRRMYQEATYPVHATTRPPNEEGFLRHGGEAYGPRFHGLATPAILTIRSLVQTVCAVEGVFVRNMGDVGSDLKGAILLDAIAREAMDSWAAHEWTSWSDTFDRETHPTEVVPDPLPVNARV